MKSVQVTGPDTNSWVDIPEPVVGPNDVLIKIKACGICGSDAFYSHVGGIPPRQGETPLGHEPSAEVVQLGGNVAGIALGDHVVIDTMRFTDGLLGSGGAQGALTPFVVVKDFEVGKQLRVIPKDIPWTVAALNEPMAVAHHAVNRSGAAAGDKAVVFGAGPIGLGALLSLKSKGVAHVVVVDIVPARLEKALAIGADAVVNSTQENVLARLIELHGGVPDALGHGTRAATEVYIDAAGVGSVIDTVLAAAKNRAVLTIPAVHKAPVSINFGEILMTEVDIRMSMGYPTEIFEVTDSIIANPDKYARIISNTVPFEQALDALTLAKTPGAADKVMVVFD